MKLPLDPRLPQNDDIALLRRRLYDVFRETAAQVNALSEGQAQATYNATTAAPTVGNYRQGDVVKNSAPTEQGTAGSKYVVLGWICTVSGSPGTFVPMRVLTGN